MALDQVGPVPDLIGYLRILPREAVRGTLRGTISVDNHASIISPISGFDEGDPIYASAHTIHENAQVSLQDPDDYLTLFGADIQAGAQFSGLGELWSGQGSELNLADRSHVGVTFVNFGHRLTMRHSQVGKVSARRLKLREQGTVVFDLADLPQTNRYDEFTMDRNAIAGGSLEVAFGISLPPVGTRWPIIKASDSVTGAFSHFSYTGLSPFRTAYLEYFEREVHVVIGGPQIVDEVDIPERVPWDWKWRIPVIPDFTITLEVRHPGIIRIEELQLVAAGIGTTTLRITVRDEFGNTRTRQREITVHGSRPPLNLTAKGDLAEWLAETVDPVNDPHEGRLDVDDDQDGVDRIWEYLQGGSPRKADPSGLNFQRDSNGTIKLHLRLARRATGRFDLQLERSTDGHYWSPVNEDPVYPPPAQGEETGQLSWTLASQRALSHLEEPKAAIYRLRIVGPRGQGTMDQER